ncbi:hypothetical protein HLH26_08970 [Gluconacetobacter sp. 1b LMG 1731]|uniref:Uncharacterized protein n=1 Tax=Gluconacetobacter dulcium TaxID=2729096 RepID=A0A7W4IL97_9PROT|nr:hypothetical protein [Gluconacetobacter dulcium]MBB2164672.1 hypothetical protein [Gluconacetobacter dulcium]MBB2193808.1 hypothetical protein [Gluconacetobacter dulcium]
MNADFSMMAARSGTTNAPEPRARRQPGDPIASFEAPFAYRVTASPPPETIPTISGFLQEMLRDLRTEMRQWILDDSAEPSQKVAMDQTDDGKSVRDL